MCAFYGKLINCTLDWFLKRKPLKIGMTSFFFGSESINNERHDVIDENSQEI